MLENVKQIVVVGVGGTGSFLLPPLIRYLNSRSDLYESLEVILCDGDKYDKGNISRQEFAHSLIGQNKAEVQATIFNKKFPDLNIISVGRYLGADNIKEIIREHSIVFVCVDNHFCRNLISKHAQTMSDVLIISGGNEETDGNVQSYIKENGTALNAPIEVRHPEIETTQDGDRSEMSCEELAQLPGGGQVIFANLFSATLMCSVFYGYVAGNKTLKDVQDIYFDVKQAKTARIVNGKFD